MPRKGENIYKRKDGRWEGRYIKARNEDGKAVYGYIYAHSYREVKQKLLHANQTASADSVSSKNESNDTAEILFGEIANLWLKTLKPQIKESTYVKYSNVLKNYILPQYCNTNITKVTYSSLEEFSAKLLISGGIKQQGLSAKTVSDIVAIIRAIMIFAAKHEYEVSFIGKGVPIKQTGTELTILTRTEQTILQQYLIGNMNNKNFGLLVCLYTGIRVGEICSLRWDDISVSEKSLYIHSTMQRIQCEDISDVKTKVIITTPKSKCSLRRIPIPDCLVDIIQQEFQNHSGYVLTSHETKFIEPRSMQNHFKKVLKQCQLRDVNFHVLRHTFATRCVELNFDIKSLSEILGHASVNITMNRYVHPSMELKRENMNKLSDLFAVK